ncbi:hypothetical protein B0T37_07940 [Chromobacterium violaceum]|uniref:hypothetical protein n=1 Tax=Chromobacterium violaceum TaxID=536 RepID=UPI0009D94021|nr:hypothetical protein [Chromobacterium violaceum]OQS11363.1 hypothetical protein B0T38_05300 [Chromobacterium violaceum]OQS27787.1 hypothetical protein B0T37_07940 [Chromobacterium violaceum]
MATYLQLGHESWSLLGEVDGGKYAGFIISPVNDSPLYVQDRINRLGKSRSNYEIILDPQLYNPTTERGQLCTWSYYPDDFLTADHQDEAWWFSRGYSVVDAAEKLQLNAVCSPALFPRIFSDDYYKLIVSIGNSTKKYAEHKGIDTILTVIVNLRDLANPTRAYEISSIITESSCERVYLIFLSEEAAQKEPLRDSTGLPTAIHLIRLLSQSMRVHVAFSGHDVLLWKFAGATDVSTGKWMNVRRFSPARWRDEENQGRQIAYWNEDWLLTLIRDQEVLRLDREGWFEDRNFETNPISNKILAILRDGSGAPWLKLSWLQYLRWFSNIESYCTNANRVESILENSDQYWEKALKDMRILFTDRFNTGEHVRIWLNAVREGGRR